MPECGWREGDRPPSKTSVILSAASLRAQSKDLPAAGRHRRLQVRRGACTTRLLSRSQGQFGNEEGACQPIFMHYVPAAVLPAAGRSFDCARKLAALRMTDVLMVAITLPPPAFRHQLSAIRISIPHPASFRPSDFCILHFAFCIGLPPPSHWTERPDGLRCLFLCPQWFAFAFRLADRMPIGADFGDGWFS